MIGEICAEIKNYFVQNENDKHFGKWSIINGAISPSINFPTNYIRIVGSRFNDGVHRVNDDDLIDETEFDGAIWIMSPPKSFLDLVKEITEWQTKNGSIDSVAMSPFSSESFGGYSYTKSAGASSDGSGGGANWRAMFASRLNIYRRIRI